MPNPTAFPDALLLPSDPNVCLSPQQLHALFPDKEANQRFVSHIARLTQQSHSAPEAGTSDESTVKRA